MSDRFDINKPSSAVFGFFDGVHRGHIAVIENAVKMGLQTVVVTFEHPTWKIRNGKPCREITTKELKEQILKELNVDAICFLNYDMVKNIPPRDFIKNICAAFNIKYISTGFNYRFGKKAAGSTEELKAFAAEFGAEAFVISPVCFDGRTLSSTRIRSLIEKGEAQRAAEMLSRPFAFYGPVIHGHELGRTLGIPTINQLIPETQILPKFGVYASKVNIDGKVYFGVSNVGVKPTVSKNEAPLCETFILDYSGDLYGKVLRVDILKFIRPEMKFGSIELLKAQMKKDSETSKNYLLYNGNI